MRLVDLFEARFQEIPHHNPSVGTLKALARANKYHSARFVIYKDGSVVAADSEHFTHHSAAPAMGAWALRGYVQYLGDDDYAYRSMEVYSPTSVDHPIFRVWERAGIENGNPAVVEEKWSNSINCNAHVDFRERANRAETGIIYETTDQPLPTKVYHVSRKRNRGSILKLGLAPKTKEHTHILRKPGVFAFETLEQAQDWAWNWAHEAKEPMDIWEVNVRNSDDLQPDPSREMQEIYDCWVIYKPVPVTDLRLSAIQPIPQGFFYKTSNPKKLRYLQELGHLSEPNSIHKAIPQMKQSASHPRSVSEAVKGDEITRLLGNADQSVKDWARQQQWVMATIAFPGISGDKLPNEQQVKYYQQKLIRGESVPPAVMGPDGKLIAGIDQAQAAAGLSLKVLVWLPKSSPSISEAWTKKYKRSIDCSKPRGFSQQAHCAGRKKRQAGGKTKSSSVRENRMDALVESMLTQLTAQGLTEAEAVSHIDERLDEDLRKWFKQKWVRFGPDGRIRGACARGSEGEGKPKCLPQKKAWALGKKKRATAAARKRREDPNPEREGGAKNVATKESQNFAHAILAETAEESQDINTLAKFITSNILNKNEFDYAHVYKLVPAEEWPKIKSPIIQQMLSVLRIKNIKDPTRTANGTIGRDDDGSLWMYIAPGYNPIRTASTVAHELAHALDLIKSQGKVFKKSRSYHDKPDSSVWTADDWKNYRGNPMEINARFAEVLIFISDDVIDNLHNDPNWSLSRDHLVNWITKLFRFYKIDRSLFGEGPKGQKSYNRLLSRTMQFYQQLLQIARQDAVQKPGLLKKISTAVSSQVAKLISTFGLGKKGPATAARRKGREDPNAEREGKARNVATKESVGSTKLGDLCTIKTNFPDADFWLVRRGDRKNVGKPTKEFSPYHVGIKVTATEQLMPQYLYYMMMHLHNQGYWQTRSIGTTALLHIRTEDVKNIQLALTEHELKENSSCPHCGGHMVSHNLLNEKKDACYYKVKSRYKVWPSAYASGALVQCRKKGAKNWGNKGKKR